MIPLSSKEAAKLGLGKQSKYRAVPTVVDGIRFASKREAKRYSELKLMERDGAIHDLVVDKRSLRYPLYVNGVKIATYEADFRYFDQLGKVLEDVKGFKTPAYRMKRLLMKAVWNIEIREV